MGLKKLCDEKHLPWNYSAGSEEITVAVSGFHVSSHFKASMPGLVQQVATLEEGISLWEAAVGSQMSSLKKGSPNGFSGDRTSSPV